MRSFCIFAPLLLITSLLAACAQLPNADLQTPTQARYYQVRIPAADGTLLTATVYQPALPVGASAPLIVHTHAYAGWRMTSPDGFYSRVMISGQAALAAWHAGYWVISYDQRGWGQSGGRVMLMDPDYEVRDVSRVIDWALAHLPTIQGGVQHPRIGMIGESYGGAVQLLASARDRRISAIVPIATWYDLSHDLAPEGIVKTTWLGVLGVTGELMSHGDAGILLHDPYLGMIGGHLSSAASDALYRRSPARDCLQGHPPQADALLIQGLRDSLFPLDDAMAMRECILNAHHDAQLIALQGGHMLFWPLQVHAGMPLFHTDKKIACLHPARDLSTSILAWWDHKLRDRPDTLKLPPLCINLGGGQGLALSGPPRLSPFVELPHGSLRPLLSGRFDGFSQAMLRLSDALRPAAAPLKAATGGLGRALFLPLPPVAQNSALLGSAGIDIELTSDHADLDTPVFVALGRRRHGHRSYRVLSDQWTPLPGLGHWQLQLPSVSAVLQAGDQLGLVVRGFSGQYLGQGAWTLSSVDLVARLALPQPFPYP